MSSIFRQYELFCWLCTSARTHRMSFLSRSRILWGRKIMFLSYGLYWKGDFCGSLQSELPKDLEEWGDALHTLCLGTVSLGSAKPSPREEGLPPSLPPPLSLVRWRLPLSSRRNEKMQSPFILPWICGDKSGHVSSLKDLVQEERMQQGKNNLFWELTWQPLPAFRFFPLHFFTFQGVVRNITAQPRDIQLGLCY